MNDNLLILPTCEEVYDFDTFGLRDLVESIKVAWSDNHPK